MRYEVGRQRKTAYVGFLKSAAVEQNGGQIGIKENKDTNEHEKDGTDPT